MTQANRTTLNLESHTDFRYNNESELFVLGDNYIDSYDSKNFGPINIDWIKYKIILKLWPLGKLNSL